MAYKGYYGRFEIHDVFSTIPKDSYLVTRNGILSAYDLDLNVGKDVIPLSERRTGPLCPVVECPQYCKKQFVKSEGCLVCVCSEDELLVEVQNIPQVKGGECTFVSFLLHYKLINSTDLRIRFLIHPVRPKVSLHSVCQSNKITNLLFKELSRYFRILKFG